MLLLNRIFVPSPPKGRKSRGGSANAETVFARTPRKNFARGRRETVAESSPARDVSPGQGAVAFFQIKKAPFSRSLFVGINRTFVPSSPKGRKRRGGSANVETVFARTPRERTSPADAGRQSPRAAQREMFRQGKARRRRNSRAISRRSNEEPAETGRQAPQTPRRFCPTQYPTESGSGTRTISAPSARSLVSKLA